MIGRTLPPASWSISSQADVVTARRYGLRIALQLGFPEAEATKIAVVISELGRNILLYAKRGFISLTPVDDENGTFVKIVAEDKGPGIENVERVLAGGYTTSKGLGLGVSGSKRLMDEFEIESEVGVGTKITAVKRLRKR
ncbi:MAG: anti-sigma regulatory factor [Thermoflexales bacterium]|nr:anti-sigma regulatory factor [Thermoflexales bacterium]